MKKIFSLRTFLVLSLVFSGVLHPIDSVAQKKSTNQKKTTQKTTTKKSSAKSTSTKSKAASGASSRAVARPTGQGNQQIQRQIQGALSQMREGKPIVAANTLLALSRRRDVVKEKSQVKYFLGLALMEMKLNQVAAFQFVDVIRANDSGYLKQALEKLLVVTDRLGDETLLNFALQRIDVAAVPAQNRDMLYYRIGEIQQKSGNHVDAIQSFKNVGAQSQFYTNSLYGMGLSLAESGKLDQALGVYKTLFETRLSKAVTDTTRVSAQMGIARILYQQQKWDESVEAYSRIPRDHRFWHDSIFERSWAMLRSGRFRSSLSNFHSLHSSYYDNFYIPESLLLRSIVYLYICKYDEMEKVLELYDKQYNPVESRLTGFLKTRKLAESYYSEIEGYLGGRETRSPASVTKTNGKLKFSLPPKALSHISEEGDVRRMVSYIRKVQQERQLIDKNAQIKSTGLGSYASKLLNNRLKNARATAGEMVKAHMQNMLAELKDLKDQTALIRYEMINGQKEAIKKRIIGKELPSNLADDNRDRSFYVQNGYEYYPFQGEYWLDEVGNYHYLGKQSCE